MAVWRYGSGDLVDAEFGVGESTCTEACLEEAQAIYEDFGPEFLAILTYEKLKKNKLNFLKEGVAFLYRGNRWNPHPNT